MQVLRGGRKAFGGDVGAEQERVRDKEGLGVLSHPVAEKGGGTACAEDQLLQHQAGYSGAPVEIAEEAEAGGPGVEVVAHLAPLQGEHSGFLEGVADVHRHLPRHGNDEPGAGQSRVLQDR